jgi:sugar/nucleoside kinase (ribokinase family)
MAEMTTDDLPMEYLTSSRHFHLSSLYLQRALQPGLAALLRQLKLAGLTISLDTNDDPDNMWGGVLDEILDLVDILLPSDGELIRMAGSSTLEQALEIVGRRVPTIVVKCGSKGALVQNKAMRQSVPGISVVPVDTIGAGDSFKRRLPRRVFTRSLSDRSRTHWQYYGGPFYIGFGWNGGFSR